MSVAPVVISAALVKELRERTQAPMMDCKRALAETDGDLEAAQIWLRERGIAKAQERQGRLTSEGRVALRLEGGHGALVAVGCETDPVAKTEAFQEFVDRVLDAIFDRGVDVLPELEDPRQDVSAQLQENVAIVGATRFTAAEEAQVAGYVHPPAAKLGVLLHLKGGDEELGRKLAMHVAAAAPSWVSREDVPAEVVAQEREIYENSDEVKQKPEQAREKIVSGMLEKRLYAAQVLSEQEWIHDSSLKVKDILAAAAAEVLEFSRLNLSR